MPIPKPSAGVLNAVGSAAPDLWRGLVFCCPALDGALFDYASLAIGTKTGAPAIIGTPVGRAVNFPSSAGATFADQARYQRPSTAITIAVAYTKTAINLFDSGHVLGKTGANVNEGSWSINTLDDDTQNPRFSIATGDFSPTSTSGVAVTQNVPVLAVGRWVTGSPLELHVYSLLTAGLLGSASTANTTATIFYGSAGPVSLSCRGSTPGNFVQGRFFGGYVWSRRLSDADVLRLVADPWLVVRPRPSVSVAAIESGGGGGSAVPVFAHHYRQMMAA